MATVTEEIANRIETGLSALLAELEWLPQMADEWNELTGAERASYAAEWDHLLVDYLGELDRFYRSEQMSREQRARYLALARHLKDALPHFRRLGLVPLPVSLEP